MTTVFKMPDGTQVRVNDEDADNMPDDWENLGQATDNVRAVLEADLQDETAVKTKPRTPAKGKVRKPSEA